LLGVANFPRVHFDFTNRDELYNSPTNRDHSLRSEANFLRKHEERRTYQTKYNVVGVLFIT